nr:hypothetical protein BdHM001_19630 [Bdellovibrio sp. HM001]
MTETRGCVMKRNSFVAALSVAFAATLSVGFVSVTPKVIYGDDNRVDVYQVQREDIRQLADSTVALIPKKVLYDNRKDGFTHKPTKYGWERELCSDEAFYEQPTSANCSGSLVGADLIATAGHCVKSTADCKTYSFVFGYRMVDAETAPLTSRYDDVYDCKEVVYREYSSKQDYALIRLDRSVLNRTPVRLQRGGVQPGDELFVIGHPAGLPTKVAAGAHVRSVSQGYFTANLDTYGGNSGSAVFNARTNEVVGILVRGEMDFEYDSERSCNMSYRCQDEDCRGEDVTDISFIIRALQRAKGH